MLKILHLSTAFFLLLVSQSLMAGEKLKWRTLGLAKGGGEQFVNAITRPSPDAIYLAGAFKDTLTYFPSDSTLVPSNYFAAGQDMFLMRLNSLGAPVWFQAGGGSSEDEALDLCTDAIGSVYVLGVTHAQPKKGIKKNVFFVVKYRSNGEMVWIRSSQGDGEADAESILCTQNHFYITVKVKGGQSF